MRGSGDKSHAGMTGVTLHSQSSRSDFTKTRPLAVLQGALAGSGQTSKHVLLAGPTPGPSGGYSIQLGGLIEFTMPLLISPRRSWHRTSKRVLLADAPLEVLAEGGLHVSTEPPMSTEPHISTKPHKRAFRFASGQNYARKRQLRT